MDERIIETMDFTGYEIVGREMFVRKNFWIDFNPVKKDHHIHHSESMYDTTGESAICDDTDGPGRKAADNKALLEKEGRQRMACSQIIH